MKKPLLPLLGVLALTLTLVPSIPSRAAAPVRIGVVLPLSGPGGFAGGSEKSALDALAVFVNKNGGIRGQNVEFAFADDQSNPQLAVQLTNGLIANHANVILGSGLTATCNAMAALNKSGPLIYCFSGGFQPVAGSYTFGASISSTYLVGAGVHYLRARNLKKIATIMTTDSTGQDGDRAMNEAVAAEGGGLTIVAREHFTPSDVTVAAQMARIKSAAPDAIVAWTTGTPLATVLRAINDAGMENVPIIVSSGNAVYTQLKQYDAFVPKELLIPSDGVLAPERVTDARQRAAIKTVLTAMAPAKADFLSITSWDPGLLVVAAMRALGADASPERLRAYLSSLKGFVGVNGLYDFAASPNRGTDQHDVYIVRYNPSSGSFTGVSRAGGEPVR